MSCIDRARTSCSSLYIPITLIDVCIPCMLFNGILNEVCQVVVFRCPISATVALYAYIALIQPVTHVMNSYYINRQLQVICY